MMIDRLPSAAPSRPDGGFRLPPHPRNPDFGFRLPPPPLNPDFGFRNAQGSNVLPRVASLAALLASSPSFARAVTGSGYSPTYTAPLPHAALNVGDETWGGPGLHLGPSPGAQARSDFSGQGPSVGDPVLAAVVAHLIQSAGPVLPRHIYG